MFGRNNLIRWLIGLVLLTAVFLTSNCNTPIPSVDSDIIPTATRIPIGLNRENPLNGRDTISLKNWELTVSQIVRGPEAWKHLHDANQFNKPAPDGWSYILIYAQLHRKGSNQVENSLGIHLTGSANILYYSFNTSAVSPEPFLDTYIAGGETSEGWETYLIHDDESDLMLVLEDWSDIEEPQYFARLNEDAVIIVPPALADIAPTTVGLEPADAILFGQQATGEDWQITVQDVQQGDAAWARLKELNPYNTPPLNDQMYVLVKVWVRYIGSDPLGAYTSNSDFVVMNDANDTFTATPVSGLNPVFPFTKLYPGGEYSGWLAYLVNKRDESLILQFESSYYGTKDSRYFSLQQSGR